MLTPPLPASLVKGRWRRSAGGIPILHCRPYIFKLPVGAGHARPARFRKLLYQLRQPVLPPTTPATSTSRPRGISRALKTARGAVFAPRYAGRGVTTCGYRIRLRPLGGACLLRPLRLLRLPVSAAGGGRLRSRLFDSRTPLRLTMYNKKKKAQPLAKLSFLVTRASISRGLKNNPQDCFLPPAGGRPVRFLARKYQKNSPA